MDSGIVPQPTEILFGDSVVLATADQLADFLVECLDTDFELQGAGGELQDQAAERVRQTIGDHFKVQEQSRFIVIEKELQNRLTDSQVQIECAIDKLELPCPLREQSLHRRQKQF